LDISGSVHIECYFHVEDIHPFRFYSKARGNVGPNTTVVKSGFQGHIFSRIMVSRPAPGDGLLCFAFYRRSYTSLF